MPLIAGTLLERAADHAMGKEEVLEVIAAEARAVEHRVATQALDRGVVQALAEDHLGVAVQERGAGAPEAVPEKHVVAGLGVGVGSFFDVDEATDDVDEDPEPDGPVAMVPAPHPTPWMTIEQTSRIEDLPNFVISDPRLVLYDVAAGRQLARTWLTPAQPPGSKKRRGAVRVYVCDASGSMKGARARFRDAVDAVADFSKVEG